jgi:hypothetical protein
MVDLVTVDMAVSFLRTGHKGSLEMNCLAGFIHARENAADLRKIIGPAQILKSENIGENPGIRRSICKKKSLPMRCTGSFDIQFSFER